MKWLIILHHNVKEDLGNGGLPVKTKAVDFLENVQQSQKQYKEYSFYENVDVMHSCWQKVGNKTLLCRKITNTRQTARPKVAKTMH